MKQLKARKVDIEKIDKFELRFHNDNSIYSVKTQEEADKLKERLEAEEKKRIIKLNDENRYIRIRNEKIHWKLIDLIESLPIRAREYTKAHNSTNDAIQKGIYKIQSEIYKNFRVELKRLVTDAEKKAEEQRRWD